MREIFDKPMLAAKNPVFENIKFPVLATPKIDGIRCLVRDGKALSRSFKPIPNHHIRTWIEQNCPDGFDGEIICGNGFNDVQSLVMTREGTPEFTYLVFDYVKDSLVKPYSARIEDLVLAAQFITGPIKILVPLFARNLETLEILIDQHLIEGYEGTMIRTPESPYKCGRSSLKEGYLVAIKHFTDDEAEVIGFEEQMENTNEKTKDAFGNSERSSHLANLVPKNTLGAFIVRHKDGREFRIGTGKGLTMELRKEIWDNKEKYLGKLVHYRSQPHGVKENPRIPSWYGFRNKADLSE